MPEFMLGSSIFPSMVWIAGKERQLGDVVARACADSGLTIEAWNALVDLEREHRLVEAFYAMKAEEEHK
jgi:hypothetical protein